MIEIVDNRTSCSKTYALSGNKYQMDLCSSPIHYISPVGYGTNLNKLEYIDKTYNLSLVPATAGKSYNNMYLNEHNTLTVGFRNDKKTSKMIGVRPKYYDGHEVEFTLYGISTNTYYNYDIKITDIQLSSNICIHHKLKGGEDSYTYLTGDGINNAIKIDDWITDAQIEYELNLTGYTIKDYTPDDIGRIYLIPSSSKCGILTFNNPHMSNDSGNVSLGLSHEIISSNKTLIYKKYLTQEGKDWLLSNQPPYYIDVDFTASGMSYDVYMQSTKTDSSSPWDTVHGATSGNVTLQLYAQFASISIAARNVYNGKNYSVTISRSLFPFSTSALPDDATIDDAEIFISGMTNAETSGMVFEGSPDSDPPTLQDYDSYESTQCSDAVGWSTGGNTLELNAAGIAAISKTDTSWFMVREYTYDVLDVDPAEGQGAGDYHGHNGCYFSDCINTAVRPRLYITYHLGPSDCNETGEIALNPEYYGDETYLQVEDAYDSADESRLYNTCS